MSKPRAKYVDQVIALFGLNDDAQPRDSDGLGPTIPEFETDPLEHLGVADSLAAQPPSNSETFEDRLQDHLSHQTTRESLLAGHVHMINTDIVRQRMGDRWPKFSKRVHEVIKTELKARLSPQDLFTRVRGDSYLIVFGDCSEVEARLKVAILSEQILETLLGEAEAKDIQSLGVQRLIVRADGSVFAEDIDSVDALMAMLDRVEASGIGVETYSYEDAAAGQRALTPEATKQLLAAVNRELEQIDSDQNGPAVAAAKGDWVESLISQLSALEDAMRPAMPAFDQTGQGQAQSGYGETTEPVLRAIRETRQFAERKIDSLQGGSAVESPNIDFGYQPMWHTTSNRVGVYLCQAQVHNGGGSPLNLAAMDEDRQSDLLAIVDRMALQKVRDDLEKAAARGVLNVMMVPVHFTTLRKHGSQVSFLQLCSRIPEKQVKALSWEIIGSQAETWGLQLKSVVAQIEPFGRAIFQRLPRPQDDFATVQRNFASLRSAGVHAVGLDVAALRGSEAEKLHLLESIAELAEKHSLKCYGHGFDSLSMTICTVCMGYQHVSGPAVAAPTEVPEGIRATEMENIYGRALLSETGTGR